jgi:hypothetical protein
VLLAPVASLREWGVTVLSVVVADVFSFNSLVSFISSSFADVVFFSAEISVAAYVIPVSACIVVTAKSVSIS